MPFTIVNRREVRRAMSRTPSKLFRLTRDGGIFDYVHYRFNREGVEHALDVGDRRLPAALRTPGTAMVMVSIRVWDDDLDMIEFFDPDAGYHELWSTEPEYTSGLSRWEHRQYLAMIADGGNGAVTEGERLLRKGRSLLEQDSIVPGLAFRERAVGAALVEGEGYRRASGERAKRPGFADVPELGAPMTPGGAGREDPPTVPPQPKRKKKAGKAPRHHQAPPRGSDYGFASKPRREPAPGGQPKEAGGAGGAEAAAQLRLDRWASLGAVASSGRGSPDRTGVEPAEILMEDAGDYPLRDDAVSDEDESGEGVSHEQDEET